VNTGDYLFTHVADGVWRCSSMPRPSEAIATLKRILFVAADWVNGTRNRIKIIPSGSVAPGEIGPHLLTVAGSYLVQVINTDLTPDEMVDVETQFDASGNIWLVKAEKAKAFNGVVVISGAMD
jgi:hypothetical protein